MKNIKMTIMKNSGSNPKVIKFNIDWKLNKRLKKEWGIANGHDSLIADI
jgi:hypothetical protein